MAIDWLRNVQHRLALSAGLVGAPAVPKFFLDLNGGNNPVVDHEGQDFADQTAAVRSAIEAAADVAREDFPAGNADQVFVRIRREDDSVVATIALSLRVTRNASEQ